MRDGSGTGGGVDRVGVEKILIDCEKSRGGVKFLKNFLKTMTPQDAACQLASRGAYVWVAR